MPIPSPIAWSDTSAVRILDQTLLPAREEYLSLDTVAEMAGAIRVLRVRGAPLIGIAAAMGLTLSLRGLALGRAAALAALGAAAQELGATRPTAVNLFWALERMRRCADRTAGDGPELHAALVREASAILCEDRAMGERIGSFGAALLPDDAVVCTICNAGALATGGVGTALAPVYVAQRDGRRPSVIVPETRPLLQGSRLTAWELARAGVPCTVIADSMLASRLRLGDVAAVFVGADRIAANGDVANKIGTYALALAARAHGVPFYVAAPSSTVDASTADGVGIPIEQRAPEEMLTLAGQRTAPEGARAWNPAFDVTPAELITGIITEAGVFRPGVWS
jgi:methylthioribose-1-phosphate isomerase